MGNMEEKQKALQAELAKIIIKAESGDGVIKVEATATREIVNISIDKTKLNGDDLEEIEDLLVVVINRAMVKAAEKEAAETKNLLSDFLPPGMGDLGNLFG